MSLVAVAAVVLASCAQKPRPELEHRKVAELFGWQDILPISNQGSDPNRDNVLVLEGATRVICEPECKVEEKISKIALDPIRVQGVTIYRLPHGRIGLIYRISEPLNRHDYLVIAPRKFGA